MKILMVCLGNICRSPMAEGILKNHLKKQGIKATVDSAGTTAWHEGEPPDDRSIEVCKKYGIDISEQKSRPFSIDDFDNFDLIFAMDSNNYLNINALSRNGKDLEKVLMIMNVPVPNSNRSVPDPYYGGRQGFEMVYKMLDEAAQAIINTYFK